MSSVPFRRLLIVTPRLAGADGVSEVSRQSVLALAVMVDNDVDALDVWSLSDRCRPDCIGSLPVAFRTARGSRMVFASYGIRERSVDHRTVVLVMHVHLLPVVLPLIHRGARVMALLHGVEAWKKFRGLERAALRRAWRVAAVSHHTVARFHAANPSLADISVDVCPPGVPKEVMPSRPGISRPYALIVGRMYSEERYKGHDTLIELWSSIRATAPGARLVVVGDGDDRARLEGKVRRLQLESAITFTGPVSNERLAGLYRDAQFFVMPSLDEGFGLVYLEAMRAGKPCIAATGAAQEIIEPGVTGLLVDGRDKDALIAAVVRLFNDPVARQRMGTAAAARVAERFSAASFTARLHELVGVRADAAC